MKINPVFIEKKNLNILYLFPVVLKIVNDVYLTNFNDLHKRDWFHVYVSLQQL